MAYPRYRPEPLNPYIALTDLTISVILIVIFFVALGRLGLVNFQYKRAMEDFAAIVATLPPAQRPRWERGRNDPPGVQRWVFDGRLLFAEGKRSTASPRLTTEGQEALSGFAQWLKLNRSIWRRIRVEGHTQPLLNDGPDDWELSARRAAIVVRQIQLAGNIPPWYCAVAGRAGQNPLCKILLFTVPHSAESRRLQRKLREAGVTYSLKDGQDPEADALRRKFETTDTTLLDERKDLGEDHIVDADSPEFASLVAHFQQNERVEVLIEYTQPETSGKPPAP